MAWMYQNGLLPRLIWPLMLYEIPTTAVEALEQVISKHLRRWLGLPLSFTGLGLYTFSGKLQLPILSLVEEFKVAKARLLLTLKDSPDQYISSAGIEPRTGRKWPVSQAVQTAQSRLVHQDIVGTTNTGRQSLGMLKRESWSTADSHTRRSMVQQEIRKEIEESRLAQLVQLGYQGSSTRWTMPERKLTWTQIWHLEPVRISFLLRGVYDHILSSCQVALSQGRYRWRHDRVLWQLAQSIDQERRKKRSVSEKPVSIPFVKEGQTAKSSPTQSQGVLSTAHTWGDESGPGEKIPLP